MKKTQIFAYKGVIGIDAEDAELIAYPGNGNLGGVADASKCEFSQEAIDILKTIKRNRDVLVMLTHFELMMV